MWKTKTSRCRVQDIALALVLLWAALPAHSHASGLERYRLGNQSDAAVRPAGGYLLIGGGDPAPEALRWWLRRANRGDVVLLQASGERGFDSDLAKLGDVHSITTYIFRSRADSSDPRLLDDVRHAEAIYIEGGDQARYLRYWRDTPLQTALQSAIDSGAAIAGTSAGLAVLGDYVFGAALDTVTSESALANPRGERVLVEPRFLKLPGLERVLTDTHFVVRDRMGRLLAFLAAVHDRWGIQEPRAIAVDEDNAVAVEPSGYCRLFGAGKAYFLSSPLPPQSFRQGSPLVMRGVAVERLGLFGSFDLAAWRGTGTLRYTLEAEASKIRSTQPGGSVY